MQYHGTNLISSLHPLSVTLHCHLALPKYELFGTIGFRVCDLCQVCGANQAHMGKRQKRKIPGYGFVAQNDN